MDDARLYAVSDMSGRTVLITGASGGLGLEVAVRLAQAGARVVLGCRNPARAETARRRVEVAALEAGRAPEVDVLEVDLASLASVRAATERARGELSHLDVLVNNAGVMAVPRELTVDGFERQLATNHLGHFVLTAGLMGLLGASGAGRVVTVTSVAHRLGRIDFEDLDGERRYNPWTAYAQSKLADLLFAFELQRRLRAARSDVISLAVHPGWSTTNLQTSGRGVTGGPVKWVMDTANAVAGQSAAMGALPTLHGATSPHVTPGGFYGPGGPFGMRGYPVPTAPARRAREAGTARRLWEVSEELTAERFEPGSLGATEGVR